MKQTTRRSILGKVLILLILGLSFIGFLIVKNLSDKNFRMPGHFVVERIDRVQEGSGFRNDTVFHRMRDFQMTNQLDKAVTRTQLEGKVTIVTFFSTRDTLAASRVMPVLQKIQRTFAASDSGLHILSITTDPAYDTVGALKAYADRLAVNHDLWWFLRGQAGQAADIAQTDLGLSVAQVDSAAFSHSPILVLLDKQEFVRGYFEAPDSASMDRCVTAISLLMLEAKHDEK